MNSGTGALGRWCRTWPRRACVLAVMASIGLLTAACGSNSSSTGATGSSASTHAGKSADRDKVVAFAQCMRSHGVANFPDPGANAADPIDPDQLGISQAQYQAAKDACGSLAPPPHPTRLTTAQQQQVVSQLLNVSKCMRSHGLPSFPDPNPASTIFGQNGLLFSLPASMNPDSSQFVSAENTCKSLMPTSALNGNKGQGR